LSIIKEKIKKIMARKNKLGRPVKIELKKIIAKMRDEDNLAYYEIGNQLKMSAPLVYYHYKTFKKLST